MNQARLHALVQSAENEGLLPSPSGPLDQDSRPWPVVLLTALGAWLAAIPLTIVVAILIAPNYRETLGFYVIGTLVLAGTVVVLRSKALPLFLEQLAVPGLIVGGCSLGFALFQDLHWQGGAAAVGALALAVAVLIPRAWLRVLLAAAAATLMAIALVPEAWSYGRGAGEGFWWAWHVVAALAGVGAIAQMRLSATGSGSRAAAAIDSMVAGTVLATLVALSWWSGMAFLVGASLRAHSGDSGLDDVAAGTLVVLQAVSAVLAIAAGAWLARGWTSVRKPWCAGVAAVLIGLAWFMPALGAVLLILGVCAMSHRWKLASAAGVAFAWIVSSFYYGLEWPLATKALVLVGAGVALAGLAWFASARSGAARMPGVDALQASPRHARAGVALTLLAVLVVVNVGIWQKESIARTGTTIYVDLAPRDPRSLMQGDYMSLNFSLPRIVESDLSRLDATAHPKVVAQPDGRGVAQFLRLDDGTPTRPGELSIALSFKDGRWIFVTDAWFFKEGDAQRFAAARFGEFKVDREGHAVLVGLRGRNLEPL